MKNQVIVENAQEEVRPFRGYKGLTRRAVDLVLEERGFPYQAEVSVTLVSGEVIRRENNAHRGVDRETDVLSFPLLENGTPEAEDLIGGSVMLGDVLVCPKVIAAQAESYGTSFRQEYSLMILHSVLHLLGLDHMEEEEKKEMFALQELLLSRLGEGSVKTEG